MSETIIVGAIILVAAGYTVYRLFFKPSCGCGSDCGYSSGKSKDKTKGCSKEQGSCCCGK